MAQFDDLPESVQILIKHEFKLGGTIGKGVAIKLRNLNAADDPQWPAIEARIAELLAMGQLQRATLVGDTRKAKREHEKFMAGMAEKARTYNHPEAMAKVELWGRKAIWTLEEAAALSLDREPGVVSAKAVGPYCEVSEFAREFMERLDLIQRAALAGELADPTPRDAFLAWMRRYDLMVPARLQNVVQRFTHVIPITLANLPSASPPPMRPEFKKPNWEHWMRPGTQVRLWEGICLAVDIEPPRPFGKEVLSLIELKRLNLPEKFHLAWDALNRDDVEKRLKLTHRFHGNLTHSVFA